MGDTGNVVIEESQVLEDEVEVSEGLTLDRGRIAVTELAIVDLSAG